MRMGSPQPLSCLLPAVPPLLFTGCPVSHREALGVVLHKDSRWYQQWKDFRDNNVVFNRECSRPRNLADSRAVTGDTN